MTNQPGWFVLVFLIGCTTRPAEKAATDMEVERAVLWEFRTDPRFDQIQPQCRNGVVTLRGIVPTRLAGEEALERARKVVDNRVLSELEIREK
jgi:hypothetical protein